MDKKVIRKKVRESVEFMVTSTLSQMQSKEFSKILADALFDEKMSGVIHYNYIQEEQSLKSKHLEGLVDDLTNQIVKRFNEPERI